MHVVMVKSKSTGINSRQLLFASVNLLLLYAPFSVASYYTWTSDNGDTYHIHQVEDGLKICSKYRCKNISCVDFMTLYKGLFRPAPDCQDPIHATVTELADAEHHTESERSRSRTEITCCGGWSDGGRCCETIQCTYLPTNETDIYGDTYVVVHFIFKGRYQTVPIGVCGDTLNCEGTCVQMETVHSLLVFDPSGWLWWQWFSFKQFSFPSHCACHHT